MVKDLIFLRTEISSWESTSMGLHKALDNINGQMVTTIAAPFSMERSKVRGCGKSKLLIFQQISMKVPFMTI